MPDAVFAAWRSRVEATLDRVLPDPAVSPHRLHGAMRHGVLNGGKRIRPLLVYATGTAFSASEADLDDAAAAVELVHCYSLVHDDLPAMDDDALRRGQPTVHVAFDEATAILAGDALQSLAFDVLANAPQPSERRVAMLAELARDEPLSPTQFGLSTHNAIAAQYSIGRMLHGNYLAVSAIRATPEAAVIEALGLLADGAPAVLVVVYDDAVPVDYDAFVDEPDTLHAWAWRIVAPREGLPRLSLRAGEPAASGALPHSLEVLRFFLAGDASLPGLDGGGWTRHA